MEISSGPCRLACGYALVLFALYDAAKARTADESSAALRPGNLAELSPAPRTLGDPHIRKHLPVLAKGIATAHTSC